jgi:hypothetical protein
VAPTGALVNRPAGLLPFGSVRTVTLRIPTSGHDRLRKLCRDHGVSQQGLFEAATIIALEDELDPDHTDVQVAIWQIARRLEQSGALWGGKRRHRLAIRMDDCLFARLEDACRRYGVSHNGALGLVVMQWPDEDFEVSMRYRVENLHRIVDRARQIDFERRLKADR